MEQSPHKNFHQNVLSSNRMYEDSASASVDSKYMFNISKPLNVGRMSVKKQLFDKSIRSPIPKMRACCQDNMSVQNNDKMFCNFCATRCNVGFSYAGARFHKPPNPDTLPKPPVHWVCRSSPTAINHVLNTAQVDTIAIHLKGLLKVQV